jgi:hypothetical protein
MAHEGLWEQLEKLNGTETAQQAKCQYLSNPDRYIVVKLNTEYEIHLTNRQIFSVQSKMPKKPAEFLEQLCLLAYLINARDIPLANKLVKAETFPGGQFFFRGQHNLPTVKLEKVFGDCPEALYHNSAQFNAKHREYGDASIELDMLPRIPLTIVIWRGDEEFSARASILFDKTAADQLPLDALLTIVNLTVKALEKASDDDK